MPKTTKNNNPTNTPTPTVADAYAYCAHLTKSHYENFPVGSLLIPKHLRPHVQAIYAFARTADDFADEPGYTKQERLAHLLQWEQNLDKCLTEPTGPIFTALAQTIQSQQLPVGLLKDLLTAFRMDVEQNRHNTLDDLHHYCTYSANPVGRLILHLFGYHSPEANQQSDAICSGLQLANFWQDVGIDLARNRIYLPQADMEKFGVTEDDLKLGQVTTEFRDLLHHLVAHTQHLFEVGRPLLHHVHGRLRYELRLTYLGGLTILKKITQNNYDVFQKRPKIKKGDLFSLIVQTIWPLGWRQP